MLQTTTGLMPIEKTYFVPNTKPYGIPGVMYFLGGVSGKIGIFHDNIAQKVNKINVYKESTHVPAFYAKLETSSRAYHWKLLYMR